MSNCLDSQMGICEGNYKDGTNFCNNCRIYKEIIALLDNQSPQTKLRSELGKHLGSSPRLSEDKTGETTHQKPNKANSSNLAYNSDGMNFKSEIPSREQDNGETHKGEVKK